MRISLNELSVTGQKAALGVGAGIAAAEDLGRAAVWLASHGVSILPPLLEGIANADDRLSVYGTTTVSDQGVVWESDVEGKSVSAVLVGGAAADLYLSLVQERNVTMYIDGLDQPLLQIPHFANAASHYDLGIAMCWMNGTTPVDIRCTGEQIEMAQYKSIPNDAVTCRMEIRPGPPASVSDALVRESREQSLYLQGYEVDEAEWDALGRFAQRILVEATERSRAQGAGAGLRDND